MTHGATPSLAARMIADPPIAHIHEPLTCAVQRLAGTAGGVLAVVDGDRVAALLTREDLARLAARDDAAVAKLRDHVGPPLRYVLATDDVDVARATLAAGDGSAVAVVDEQGRLRGAITAATVGRGGDDAHPRPPVDPTDRRHLDHPRLEVYAPWAAVRSD